MLNEYATFQHSVLRMPKKPLVFAFDLLLKDKLDLDTYITDAAFKEALFLASPQLTGVLEKYQKLDSKKKFQLELTLFKYLIRSASRCTPFGLFSGCAIGHIGNSTHIENIEGIERYTSLDMTVLIEISQKLLEIEEIKFATKFLPNSSLYQIGNNYRYIAYYFENNQKKYKLENISYNYYLEKLLDFSMNGKTVLESYNFMKDVSKSNKDNFTSGDVWNFINELIENQLLISEISPSITGGNYLEKLVFHINAQHSKHLFKKILQDVRVSLNELDSQKTNTLANYKNIIGQLEILNLSKKKDTYFQTDYIKRFRQFSLDQSIPLKILKGIEVLRRLLPENENTYLERFKTAFIKRYGTCQVSVSFLFDQEIGLKFQSESDFNEFDLIADFQIEESGNMISSEIIKDALQFLMPKYEEVLSKNLKVLEIKDAALQQLPEKNQNSLSNTFSATVEIYQEANTSKYIFLSSAGGATACNLISRFSRQSSEVASLVSKITEKEQAYATNKILAEICHLPENRTGNVLKSKVNRAYEILYLSNSELPIERRISISDLYVSIQEGQIKLWSERLQKEIIPILSNAHNFDNSNALPIYKFLCELQFQDKKEALSFVWPEPFLNFKFLPRVQYKDIIFAKAQWRISFNEIAQLDSLKVWRIERKIPKFIQINEGDNALLLNMDNAYCIEILKKYCKEHQEVWGTEFLFTPKKGLQIASEVYANEFIVSYYKKNHEAA